MSDSDRKGDQPNSTYCPVDRAMMIGKHWQRSGELETTMLKELAAQRMTVH